MPDIFISYRRDDTSGYAGRLYDQVSAHFGDDHVFMDVADLEPGSDFVDTIEKKVRTCDALIALIGKNWLTIKDEKNQVRLSKPEDFVNVEISAALRRNIEVIPVLVGGAKMPKQSELPESLQLLSRRQALEVSDVRFARDVDDLIEALKTPAGVSTVRSPTWIKPALAFSILIISVLAAGIGFWNRQNQAAPPGAIEANTARPANSSKDADDTSVTGNWLTVVEKRGAKFEVYFTFEAVGDRLFGRAIYPTGEAGILDGKVAQGRISFTTKHTPDFADEEAILTVEGKISGDKIEVFIQGKDGYSRGVAHRVTSIGVPKVLTPR